MCGTSQEPLADFHDTVVATVNVGSVPVAFGKFIGPKPPKPAFAGTPGSKNCVGTSVSALSNQFGTLTAAANAFGESVTALQNAITAFCKS